MALPRCLWLNLRIFPLRQAVRLPLLVSNRTRVRCRRGGLVLKAEQVRMGMMKVGFHYYQHSDPWWDRTMLTVAGTLEIEGTFLIGAGACVDVSAGATMKVGDESLIGPRTLVICKKSVELGRRNRLAWCCTLMDSDQHNLVGSEGRCNADRTIRFADNVWMGCHTVVTKGTQLASNTTVGAGSVVHGVFEEECTVVAGNPARVCKRGVVREDYMK